MLSGESLLLVPITESLDEGDHRLRKFICSRFVPLIATPDVLITDRFLNHQEEPLVLPLHDIGPAGEAIFQKIFLGERFSTISLVNSQEKF